MKKTKVEKIKTIIEVTNYSKKVVKIKKFTQTKINKDGSVTKWGVSRNGHRFTQKIVRVDNERDIEKIFNEGKKQKDFRKNNITLKVKNYSGRYYKKTGKIAGGRIAGVQFFNIDKKGSRVIKGKKYIYTTSASEIVNTLKIISEDYKLEIKIDDEIKKPAKKRAKKKGKKLKK